MKNIKPDVAAYKDSVAKWGDDFTANSLAYGEHDEVSGGTELYGSGEDKRRL